MCGGPSLPPISDPTPPPSRSDAEIKDEQEKERKRRSKMTGRRSTIITGDLGVGSPATVESTSLLGGP